MSPLIRFPSSRRPARRTRSAPRRPELDELERRELLAAPGLTLDVIADAIAANAGPAVTSGTVTRTSADTTRPLTVTLTSSAPDAAAVPDSIVIPAGQTSATFPVDAPAGDTPSGQTVVTISASATVDAVLARDDGFNSWTLGFAASAVTVQSDGRIVAAGTYRTGISSWPYAFTAHRLNADGTQDLSFAGGSQVSTGVVGRDSHAQAVAVQPDGKIVVGGYYQQAGSSSWNMMLTRYNTDGTLDTSFGAAGIVTLIPTAGSYNEIWALAVQADGKILFGGDIDRGSPSYGVFAVGRLNPDGSLDGSFGAGGYAWTDFSGGSDRGFALAVQGDGKILLAGTSFGGNATSNFAVARWTAAGQLDPAFGNGGKVLTNIPGDFEQAKGLAIQPDGRIVVAGSVSTAGVYPPNANSVALVRYTASGALDGSFGSGGIAIRDLGGDDVASSVVVQPNGLIVVGGAGGYSGGSFLARFAADGGLLASIAPFGSPTKALAIQPGGRIVGAGTSGNYGSLDAFNAFSDATATDSLSVDGTQVPTASGESYAVQKGTPLFVTRPGVLANDASPAGRPLSAVLVTGPRHGPLTLDADGSFTYTPGGAYLGPDSFTYRATDGTFASNVATVSLGVTGPNDAPVVVDDSYQVNNTGREWLWIQAPGVLVNDSDPNGQPITAELVSPPAHGTLTLESDGSFTYSPSTGFVGVDTFTYRASDGAAGSDPATVSITAYGRPTAVADSYTTPQDTALTVPAPGLLSNDIDPNGLALRPIVTSTTSNGTLSVNQDGSFTYTPRAGFFGQDSFAYFVTNGKTASPPVTDTITVTFVNRPPVAAGDTFTVVAGSALTVSAPGVLANDSDPNGQPITAVLLTPPAHGSVTLNANGSFVYTPAADYTGPDGFTYKASDGQADSPAATVSLVAVSSSNVWSQRGGDAGHTSYVDARIDAAGIAEAWNQPLNYVSSGTGSWSERAVAIDATHVYRTDLEGYAFNGTYHVIAYDLRTGAPAWNRSIAGNAFEGVGEPSVAGGIVYVNRAGHSGISGGTSADLPRLYGLDAGTGATVVQATYGAQWGSNERPVIADNQLVAWDGYYGGLSAWSTSTLARQWNRAGSIYDQPMAALGGPYVYAYGNKVYLRSTGASQADMTHPLGLTLTDPMVSGSGRLLYRAAGTVGGVQRYGVAAFDAATRAPLWTAYTSATVGGKAVGNGVVAVTSGSSLILLDEVSGAQIGSWQAPANLTSEIVLTRTHAFVESSASGVARVYAVDLATGQSIWSFENRLTGESASPHMEMAFGGGYLLLSNDAFVRAFAVPGAPNRSPVAADDSYATAEGATLTVAAPGVLGNDGDPDGNPIAAALAGGPSHGTLTLNANGSFAYTPAPGFSGTDGFTYRVNDGRADSAIATVTILVDATPIAAGQSIALVQGGSKSITLRAADPDSSALTYTVVTGPAHGTLTGTAPNLHYTPDAGYSGPDSFEFQAGDGRSASAPATVTIDVKPALSIAWTSPADIVYGTPLGASQLNATANVAGVFTYAPGAGTVLGAGAGQVLTAAFTPSDPDYRATTAQTAITVLRATPTVTWATPAAITYGTPLGSAQLNAQANVGGVFSYTPGAGTILHAGAGRVLTATFTPSDPANYQGATATTTLDVRKAPLTVTPANKDMGRGDPVPPLTYTLSGFVNGDSASAAVAGSAALGTTATAAGAAGRYAITAGAGSLAAADYDFQFAAGTLTVHPKVLDVRVRWGSRSMSLIGLNRSLPFINITAVDVVFSDDVNVGVGNLALTSTTATARTYAFSGFGFNPNTDTATWTLPTALGIDRLMLALDDRFGAAIDPAISVWNTGPVRFNVLPGDVDGNGQVNNLDVGLYKKPPASLLLWMDVDGDGDRDKADEDAVRRRTGTRLP